MKNYNNKPDWNPTSRAKGIGEALPFLAMLAALAALIGGLILLIEKIS